MPNIERGSWWTRNANTPTLKTLATASTIALTFFATAARATYDIAPLAEGYQKLSGLLAADEHKATSLYAGQIARLIEIWTQDENPAEPVLSWVKKIDSGAAKMAKTSDPQALRLHYGEVSDGATHLIKSDALQASWQLFYCPMVKKYWAQPKTEKMANPYMGLEMLQCGGKKPWTALP